MNTKNSNFEHKTISEIAQSAIEKLHDGIGNNTYGCDLHNELFNQDYYIIGRYDAEQWLQNNGGIFNCIETVKEYEKSNFGECSTDLSEPEKIVNMMVYIIGEEVLSECETLQNNWGSRLDEEMIESIIVELEELL